MSAMATASGTRGPRLAAVLREGERVTPDDAYLRFVSPILGLAWLAVVRGFLNMRSPSPVSTHGRAAVPAP